ncbi:hypothetical protein [Kitasatospora purpeofusca]|uniref:hypothetical protein n=1 Tax=Kitasatospora purpeofusca TaxID=67352 RepID=UPI003818E798
MNELIKPGDDVTRQQVHEAFGGRLQGGISPTKENGILVFLSYRHPMETPTSLAPDGTLRFPGEGLEGDQQMTQGNKALLRHKQDGRDVHVFQEVVPARGSTNVRQSTYRYIGRFELDDTQPFTLKDEDDRHGQSRRVIEFRLRPLDGTVPFADRTPEPVADLILLSSGSVHPTQGVVEYSPERIRLPPLRTVRRDAAAQERALVGAFTAHLHGLGHTTGRLSLSLPDGTHPILVDLFDTTTQTIYEGWPSASRATIRLAIGRLMDLRWRHGGSAQMGIIVPSEPYKDSLDLCTSLDIELVWPDPDLGFTSSKN